MYNRKKEKKKEKNQTINQNEFRNRVRWDGIFRCRYLFLLLLLFRIPGQAFAMKIYEFDGVRPQYALGIKEYNRN